MADPSTEQTAVVPLDTPALLTSLWHDVLAPSFPPAELVPLDVLLADGSDGRHAALGVVRDGRVVAGIVGSWSPASRVLLVDYLAIAPGGRGGGVGGALLSQAVRRWLDELDPALVVAEVEHPAHHEASERHGDPAARLRFYARHGGRVLDLPYFQPGMTGPGSPRVPALLLVALAAQTAGAGADRVPAAPVRAFLTDHLVACEGTLADDGATRRLLAAASRDTVRLVDPADAEAFGTVPAGVLEGAERYAPGSAGSA